MNADITPHPLPELANHPHYEILKELGRGGMGVVYLAKNMLMDRLEVLKVVNRAFVGCPDAMERFRREIQTAAKLRHENVVGAYSVLQLGDMLGFAMEYVEGQNLSQVVEAQGPLASAVACHYIRQAALGLEHAHEKRTIHRDIKPQNLILAREGRTHTVKILDFGLAKATRDKKLDTALTGVGALLGRPDYMAPEQILDASMADIRSDIYSLGCTLYYLLTGKPPFRAKNVLDLLQAHQSTDAKRLHLVRPEISAELAAVVATMMAKDPAKRYQKPGEVAQALVPFLIPEAMTTRLAPDTDEFALASETIESEASTPTVANRTASRNGGRFLWIGGGIGALAALLVGVVLFWPKPDDRPMADSQIAKVDPLAIAPPAIQSTGILVLDNCDEQTNGKNEYRDNLTFFDFAGVQKFRVSGFNNSESVGCAHRIAVDPLRKSIWVIEDAGRRIRRFDLNGNTTLTIAPVRGSAIAVDPETGNAWVTGTDGPNGIAKTIVYDATGKVVGSHNVSGLDIVYDRKTKSFWIAHRSLSKISAATGEMQFSTGVAAFCVSSLDTDPKDGGVWVAVRGGDIQPNGNRLLKFDANGNELARVNLGSKNPFGVSVDASDGSVWVAYLRKSIERFSADGTPRENYDVAAYAVLAAKDGGVWAVTTTDTQKISPKGDVTLRLKHAGKSSQGWIASLP